MAETEPTALMPVDVTDELRALMAAHPLPAGVADADLSLEAVAQAFGKTVNTVAKWTRDGMPFVVEGGPGRAYVIRLSHAYAWWQDREEQQRSAQAHASRQIEALQAHFLGLDVGQPEAALTAKERLAMAQADLVWNQAARQRRELVRLEDVTDLCDSLLTLVREGWAGLSDRLERELGLTATQVLAVQRAAGDTINTMRARIEEADLVVRDGGEGLV